MSDSPLTCNPVGATHHWHEYPDPLANKIEVCCRCGSVRITLKRETERDTQNPGCLAELGTTDFIRVDPALPKPDLLDEIRERLQSAKSELEAALAAKSAQFDAVDDALRAGGILIRSDLDAAIAESTRLADLLAQVSTNLAALNTLIINRTNADRARLTALETQVAINVTEITNIKLRLPIL